MGYLGTAYGFFDNIEKLNIVESFVVECVYEPRGDRGMEGFMRDELYPVYRGDRGYYILNLPIDESPDPYADVYFFKNMPRKYFRKVS